MGMVIHYYSVDPSLLKKCQEDTEYLKDLIENTNFTEENKLDLGSAWDGIHFLLSEERRSSTAFAEPLDKYGEYILGENVLNEEFETEYGPSNYLTPTKVKEAVDELMDVTEDVLWESFDADLMDEMLVVPENWSQQGENGVTYLEENFLHLKTFLQGVASEDNALIIVFRDKD